MMSYLPVLIILSLMGLACFAKRFKCVSNWIHKNESFLDFLGFIGVIGLVLSLALTIYHFNYNQAAQAQLRAENKLENISDKKAVFISKTEALRTELLFSLDICLLIESWRTKSPDPASGSPNTKFHYSILSEMLIRGELTDSNLRSTLHNAHHHMQIADRIMMNTAQMLYLTLPADPIESDSLNKRITLENEDLMKKAKAVRKELEQGIKALEVFEIKQLAVFNNQIDELKKLAQQ